jgi:hypothetical protein
VLPFIADSLVVSSPDVRLGYIGANPVLQRLLVTLAAELGITAPLVAADLDDLGSVDALDVSADVIVVDLGVDASLVDPSPAKPDDYWSVEFPRGLDRAFAALERLFELERARLERGEHPRRLVLVNSATAFWNAYVLAHLDCSHTSVHSRVRRATVKPIPDEDEAAKASEEFARRVIRWSGRNQAGDGRLRVPTDAHLSIADLDDYRGFGTGWAYPDDAGIWTLGRRSELAVAFDDGNEDADLAVTIGGICVGPEDSISVELLVDGQRAALHDFGWVRSGLRGGVSVVPRLAHAVATILPDPVANRLRPVYERLAARAASHRRIARLTEIVWRIRIPSSVVAQRSAHLTFVIDEPRTPRALGWSDDERELGIHLRSLKLEERHGSAPTARSGRPATRLVPRRLASK